MGNETLLKEQKFQTVLKERDFENVFYHRYVDEHNISIFEANQTFQGGQNAYIFLMLDDSIYNTCTITFATLSNVVKKEQILELLNELNEDNKFLKYMLNSKRNEIQAEFSYIGNAEEFDADLYFQLVLHAFKTVEESAFKKVMRVLWA